MRIGIDARFLGTKQKGIGRYVQELIENLEQVVDFDLRNYEFVVFLRKENWQEYQPQNSCFKKVLADYSWYSFKEQIFFPVVIKKQKVDLMHFPHFNVPILCFCSFVVTIHDLILRRFPTYKASTLNFFNYYIKNLAYRLVIFFAVKKAKQIIAVSNFTKQDILDHFQVSPQKIKVIYEGVSSLKKRNKPQKYSQEILAKYIIDKPYLLYVGNAYPHKNLEKLIDAFAYLIQNYNINLQLVLVGEIDYFYNKLINFSQNYSNFVKNSIVFTGYVDDQLLEVLYQNALIYVFPSLCEGFGLPPLEAMAYGLPVACSKETCLPEILGNTSIYFDPYQSKAIAKTIKRLIENQKLQKLLKSSGFEKINQYCWQKTAQETLETYLSVGKSNFGGES